MKEAGDSCFGYTPLHIASAHGNVEVVKMLPGKRAMKKAINTFVITPLHLSALLGHVEVIKMLFEKEANLEAAVD